MHEGMRLSHGANNKFGGERYSKGSLYTASELLRVTTLLDRDGYSSSADHGTPLGIREFTKPREDGEDDRVYLYLDELGCDSLSSGMMVLSPADGDKKMTTMWDFLRENEPSLASRASNTLKQILSF